MLLAFGCSSWPDRWLEGQGDRLQRAISAPPSLWHYPAATSPGSLCRLACRSPLTIVQLGGWPLGARPEIGRLVQCRDKDVWDLLGLPSPGVAPTLSGPLGGEWAGCQDRSSPGTTLYGGPTVAPEKLKVPPLNLVSLPQGPFQSRPFGEAWLDHQACSEITQYPAPTPALPLPGVPTRWAAGGGDVPPAPS